MNFCILQTNASEVHGVFEAFTGVVKFGKGPTAGLSVLMENAIIVHGDDSFEIFHFNEDQAVLHDGDQVNFTPTFSTLDFGQPNSVVNLEDTRCFAEALGDFQLGLGRRPFGMIHLGELLFVQRGEPTVICQPSHESDERLTLLQASDGGLVGLSWTDHRQMAYERPIMPS